MTHPITKYGQPVLEQHAEPVTEFDTAELHKLVDDMFDSMYAARGVGLAAPQIGIGKRIAVIDLTTGEDPAQKIVLINPEIVAREGSQTSEEGCLSIPTFREPGTRAREGARTGKEGCRSPRTFGEPVTRAQKVTVRAKDASGKEFEMTGEDL